MKITKPNHFCGDVVVPGDKSISHRGLIFGAIAKGRTTLEGLSNGKDVCSTINCLRKLGIRVENNTVYGGGFQQPCGFLDCGNSGTTMRLLMGLLSGLPFSADLIGDESLSKRPMERAAIPLRKMGAKIDAAFPVRVEGGNLSGAAYALPVASAQIKSALLLAGLYANGTTKIMGKIQSRDHTERMLPYFGADLSAGSDAIILEGPKTLVGKSLKIPGDPSSAAYWAAAACMIPGAKIRIRNVSLNPTRIAFFDVLKSMGADISYQPVFSETPEPLGTIEAKFSALSGIKVSEEIVPYLIDEIPILSVLAVFAEGKTCIKGIEELRHKESDRIKATCINLQKMGAIVESSQDSLSIEGVQKLNGAVLDTYQDHRIAMAFSIAGLVAEGETTIKNSRIASISYPDFYKTLRRFCG